MRYSVLRLMLSAIIMLMAVAGAVRQLGPAAASDHDEAPLLSTDLQLNTTDFYAFLKPGLGVTPIAAPVMVGVPHDPLNYSDADTVFHLDQFVDPGFGSGIVGFTFSAMRFVSTQPFEAAFSDGSVAAYDVEVTDSPTAPSSGTIELVENTAGTGGFLLVDIGLYLSMTFTNRDTGEETVVDGGAENLPIEVEASGSYSYDCPPGFIHDPDRFTPLCIGHNPGSTSIFPTTLIDNVHPNDPHLVWRFVPASAPANNPPVLDPIGTLQPREGEATSYLLSAFDPDGDNLAFNIQNAPPYSNLVDNGDGTATLTVTPPFGSFEEAYSVTVTVVDDGAPPLGDQETFDIIIAPGFDNDPPVLEPIGDQTVPALEFETTIIFLAASDANGDDLTWTVEGLPAASTFIETDATGNTEFGQIEIDPGVIPGTYTVTVTVTDIDGVSDSETFTLTVLPANQAPTLDPIPNQTLSEGQSAVITINGADGDDDVVVLTADLPGFANLTDNGDGTGSVTVSPGFDDAGVYTASVTITDDGSPILDDTETFSITVTNVNRPPVLAPINDLTVDEGATSALTITASDPDGDGLTFDVDVPPFCLLNDNGDGSADIQCSPGPDDAGDYAGTVTVTDDGDPALIDSTTLTIHITNVNRAPLIDSVSGQTTVNEGETATIQIAASDPDGDNLTMSLEDNPPFCSLVDNGSGTATVTCNPGFNDSGTYTIRVFAQDDGDPIRSTGTTITILVNDVNRPPVLEAIDDQQVVEDGELFGTFTATDPDGDTVTFSSSGLPGFCTLTDNGDNSAFFECNPAVGDAGEYTITVTVSDGSNQDTKTFMVTVQPKVAAGGPYSGTQGEDVQLAGSCDSCVDSNGNVTFAWDLDADGAFDDATGTNPVVPASNFEVGDNTIAAQGCVPNTTICNTDTTTVTVSPGNNPPVFDPVPPLEVSEEVVLDQPIIATDPDGDNITYSSVDLPAFLELDQDADGVLFLVGRPDVGDAGEYMITITATDDGEPQLSSSMVVTVTVLPLADAGGPYTVMQGQTTMLASTGPADRNYSWDLDADGVFETFGQAVTFDSAELEVGTYPVQLRVCLQASTICNTDGTEVIVEGPGIETYDELKSLVRAYVDNPIVEGILIAPLNRAQYFDEELGLNGAAVAMLRTFIVLVKAATPHWIDPQMASQLIGFAQQLIDSIVGL